MNKSFLKRYNEYEVLKYQFENGFNTEKSSICYNSSYYGGEYRYRFHCCECGETNDIDQLQFMNQKIICKCGAKFSIDDLKPGTMDWSLTYMALMKHNMLNDTFNKVSVPTIISKEKFYCPKCRSVNRLKNMPIEDKQRVCTCGESYSFEECKLAGTDNYEHTSGKVFFDGHKITISTMVYHSAVNINNIFYWQDGQSRLTMNLETGYSYTTSTGVCYTDTNRYYRNRYGKNAPKMFNSTYSPTNSGLETVVQVKYNELLYKHKDNENLFNLIYKNKTRLTAIIFKKLFKQIDEYMTAYYNNKYSYRIKSLMELVREYKSNRGESHLCVGNKDLDNDVNYPSMYDSTLLALRNRFINASFKDLKYNIPDILLNIRETDAKRRYKLLPRESNNVALDYICNNVSVSKSLRKRINAELNDFLINQNYSHMSDRFYCFVNFAKHFKNKENINKLYNTLFSNEKRYVARYMLDEETLNLWLTYRNEQYLSNCNLRTLRDKAEHVHDALRTINRIKDVLGEDWDINTVKFHTEEQYHNDLVKITNSDDFIEMYNRQRNAQALEPFKMEDEIFEIEEKENDFYVARNRAILTNIGQAMGICVGGYGGSVEAGACRIAYLKENGIYKVCLELRKHKNKQTNKMEYTIVQAKMQYNNLVGNNQEYYNKVVDWATRNNIKIDTHDMQVQNVHRVEHAELIEF